MHTTNYCVLVHFLFFSIKLAEPEPEPWTLACHVVQPKPALTCMVEGIESQQCIPLQILRSKLTIASLSYMPYYVSHYLADFTQGGLFLLSQYALEALPETGPIDLEPLFQELMSSSKYRPGQCSSVP